MAELKASYNSYDFIRMVDKVRGVYRSNGYFLAQAYIPKQEFTNGALQINLIEGRIGVVSARQKEGAECMSSSLLEYFLREAIPTDSLITEELLEVPLMALADGLPCEISSEIRPNSSRVGYADFLVNFSITRE